MKPLRNGNGPRYGAERDVRPVRQDHAAPVAVARHGRQRLQQGSADQNRPPAILPAEMGQPHRRGIHHRVHRQHRRPVRPGSADLGTALQRCRNRPALVPLRVRPERDQRVARDRHDATALRLDAVDQVPEMRVDEAANLFRAAAVAGNQPGALARKPVDIGVKHRGMHRHAERSIEACTVVGKRGTDHG